MKQLIYAAIIGSFAFTSCSSKSGAGSGSQDTPESAAQMVFDAAKSGDYSHLKDLCNESLQPDKDSKMICDVSTGDQELKDKFKGYFAQGKVVGSATIEGETAKVNVKIGNSGEKDETFNMAKKDGKWYLTSF
jgi:hypothetical protein